MRSKRYAAFKYTRELFAHLHIYRTVSYLTTIYHTTTLRTDNFANKVKRAFITSFPDFACNERIRQ